MSDVPEDPAPEDREPKPAPSGVPPRAREGWLARLTRGVLRGSFEGRERLTPFARWASVAGLWPMGGLCVLLILVSLRRGKNSL